MSEELFEGVKDNRIVLDELFFKTMRLQPLYPDRFVEISGYKVEDDGINILLKNELGPVKIEYKYLIKKLNTREDKLRMDIEDYIRVCIRDNKIEEILK